ncbi:MAG: alpha/beta fold hydrolase [Actinomycetota bacterium]
MTPGDGITTVRELPGVRVAYDLVGDGPPVVLIHGWACCRSDFAGVAADLARDHRLMAIDLPWHGESTADSPHWTMDDLGALVDAVVADEGLRGAPMVGHSMGVAVAIEAVLAGEGQHIIGLDGLTFMHMYPKQPADRREATLAPYREDFAGAVHGLCTRASAPGTDPALTARIAANMAQMDPDVGVRMLGELLDWDMDAALGRADALGLHITALAADAMLAPEVMEAYGHRFEIIPVELGGHFYLLERPAETAELIRRALTPVSGT